MIDLDQSSATFDSRVASSCSYCSKNDKEPPDFLKDITTNASLIHLSAFLWNNFTGFPQQKRIKQQKKKTEVLPLFIYFSSCH